MVINAKRKFEEKQATDSNSDTSDEIEVLCEKTPEVCEAEKIEKAKRDGNFINLVDSEPAVDRSKRQKTTTISQPAEPAVKDLWPELAGVSFQGVDPGIWKLLL